MQDLDLTIEEVDTLTGPAIGRAKSATFRTADIAGVDVCVKVAANLYDAVPERPGARALQGPRLHAGDGRAEAGSGEKAGAGFYRKEGEGDPHPRLEDARVPRAAEAEASLRVEAAQSVADLGARINQILAGKDKARASSSGACSSGRRLYAASLVPEISDDVWSRRPGDGVGLRLGPRDRSG